MARKPKREIVSAVTAPQMTVEEKAKLDANLAHIFNFPTRWYRNGSWFLIWTENSPEHGVRMMQWEPETPQEIADATRFYEAANGFGPFVRPVLPGKRHRRHPDELALIRGINDHRDDDLRLLVYADWLTDHGRSQGELIRVVMEKNGLPEGHPRHTFLHQRWRELVAAHDSEWFQPLAALGLRQTLSNQPDAIPGMWYYKRGVIEEIIVDRPGLLPDTADRLFAAAPLLRKLTFATGHLHDLDGLAKVKQLEQVDELDCSNQHLYPHRLEALLGSKYLTRLRSLTLESQAVGDGGLDVLIRGHVLAGLTSLSLTRCGLTAEGIRGLVRSPKAGGLRSLDLGHNGLGDDALGCFADGCTFANLQWFHFRDGTLTATGVERLGRAVFAEALTDLDLRGKELDPVAFRDLCDLRLPRLRRLWLNRADRGPETGAALASAAWRDSLESLDLESTMFENGSLTSLAEGRFPVLRKLNLSGNRVGDLVVDSFATSDPFPTLEALDLSRNQIGPTGVFALFGTPAFANLLMLDLSNNPVGPGGAAALAKSLHLPRLGKLIVDAETVGSTGKTALLDRFGELVVSFR